MTETAATAVTNSPGTGDIVARASSWERKKFLLIALGALAWGGWSLYDGYVRYPRGNQAAIDDALRQNKPPPEKLPHGGYDIPLNQLIGWTLQPVGLFL